MAKLVIVSLALLLVIFLGTTQGYNKHEGMNPDGSYDARYVDGWYVSDHDLLIPDHFVS